MAEFNLIVPSFLLDYRSVTLYQEWLNLGNEGTMADFIAWLRTPATEAAGIALQAAATANVAIQEMATALQEAEETAAVWAAAEAGRASAESGRVTAETTRGTNESNRQSAENGRATAETTRGTNESNRQSAESGRVTAENARGTNESNRQSAESGRVTAENTRGANETERQTAETVRTSAESSRATAETGRTTAESARVSAETTRGANETGRQTAETARIGAESSRATAETGRTTAETARVTAENARNVASNAYNLTVSVPLGSGYYTLATAVAAVVVGLRKKGLTITFEAQAGVWETYQFVGASTATWTTLAQWVKETNQLNVTELLELPIAEVLNVLYAKIQALEAFIKTSQYGNITADQLDVVRNFNIWGKTNLIVEGTAAPAVAPDFVGQTFINTVGGVTYTAKGNTSVADWKQTSN